MSSLTRTFLCMLGGFVLGGVGLMAVAIFGPLVYPLSLSDSESARSVNMTIGWMFAFLFGFGAAGFALCWKLTKRAVKD